MIVTLDGQRVDANLTRGATLKDLIEQIRTAHLSDRLVVSVAVDGQVLEDAELTTELGEPVRPDTQVDLESADRAVLVSETFLGLAAEFERGGSELAQAADRLNGGESAAISDIGEFMRLWQTAYRALSQCSELLHRDLLACRHNGSTVRESLTDMVAKLTQVRDALEARDIVLQADLVRYELPVLAKTWQKLLMELAGQIETST
jgi:hypothetical protein